MALPAEGDRQGSRWRWAQGAVLALTAVLLVGLWLAPVRFLALFWGVVIPLLPLSFLVSPQLWRAVCPLATLNMFDQRTGRRRRSMAISRWSEAPAIIALVVLVPARHLAFNHEAWTLALLVVAAAAAAFLAGRWFEAKAGFCNLLCPVLPVERLYGQHPLINVANPRCPSCSVCTPRGCIDLAGTKALPQLLGPRRRTTHWMLTGFGLFALAFPAFIAGYFTVPTSPVPVAMAVYAHVFGWSAAGGLLAGSVISVARIPSRVALILLAATAAGIYYWFAIPLSLGSLGVHASNSVPLLRVVLLAFIGWWTARAFRAPASAAGALQGQTLFGAA